MKRMALLTLCFLGLSLGGPLYGGQSPDRPLRLSYLQNDIHHLACWVALEKGFFQGEGADVKIAGIFKAGPETMSAFAAGSLDMAYVGEAPSTTAVANKAAEVVVVAQVNTEGSAVVVGAESDLRGLSDLAGRTVVVPGHSTVQDFLLRKGLKKSGLDLEQVNIVVLKPPEMIGALRTAQIAAFIAWEPYPSQAVTSGVGRLLAASRDIWPGHPCCVLVTDSRFLKAHPDKVQAVVRGHIRATRFIEAHPEEALRIGVKYTGMDEETVRLAMQNVHFTYELSLEGEKEYVRFLSELGYIPVQDPEAFVRRFINPEILREALNK